MDMQLPQIDPAILAQIQALSGSQGLTEDEKRSQRAQAAFAAAAGLLSNMYRPTGIGIGQGISAGLLGFNEAGQSIRRDKLAGAENMQKGIQTYGALQGMQDEAGYRKAMQEAASGQGVIGQQQTAPHTGRPAGSLTHPPTP